MFFFWLKVLNPIWIICCVLGYIYFIYYYLRKNKNTNKMFYLLFIFACIGCVITLFAETKGSDYLKYNIKTEITQKYSIAISDKDILDSYFKNLIFKEDLIPVNVQFPGDTRIFEVYLKFHNNKVYPYTKNSSGVYIPFRFKNYQ